MNELTVYDRVQSPEQFVAAMGRHIARSGMFGCETEDQGCVLALECAARRMPPLSLSQRYHLIKGKLSMKADAMLGGFMAAGGKAEEIEFTSDAYEIELTRDRKKRRYRLTWHEAQQEPYVYEGKEADVVRILAAGNKPKLKPKYATPISRSQMLRARCVSNALRGPMGADIVAGYYTPEETDDFVETTARTVDAKGPTMAEVAEQVVEPAAAATVEAEPEQQPTPEDAEIAELQATADAGIAAGEDAAETLTATPVEGSARPEDKPCSAEQVEIVKGLYDELLPRGMSSDVLKSIIRGMGVERVSSLSTGGCNGLIARLVDSREIFDLAAKLKMPADTLKGVLAKASVEQPWELPANLRKQLIDKLTKTLEERSKN